jgi:predicted RNase H-like HicB family nuclease
VGNVLQIEFDREDDGRWIAEIPILPGALAYGATREEARGKVEALALRILADRLERGEEVPNSDICSCLQHEPMAFHASEKSVGGDRLEHKETSRIASRTRPRGLA